MGNNNQEVKEQENKEKEIKGQEVKKKVPQYFAAVNLSCNGVPKNKGQSYLPEELEKIGKNSLVELIGKGYIEEK